MVCVLDKVENLECHLKAMPIKYKSSTQYSHNYNTKF